MFVMDGLDPHLKALVFANRWLLAHYIGENMSLKKNEKTPSKWHMWYILKL